MPCTDGGPSREQIERDHRNHQAIIRLACDRCREIEARGRQLLTKPHSPDNHSPA